MARHAGFQRILCAATLAIVVGLGACGGDDGGTPDVADSPTEAADVPGDIAADLPGELPADVAGEVPQVHSVTSATPMVDGSVLAATHLGWQQADCAKCHTPTHGGLRPPECVVCHGSNGATNRPLGHAGSGCAPCHSSAHADVAPPFEAPRDCVSCHRFPASDVCPSVQTYDAVVVGAGGGGLAAAATLARGGMKVALVERHNKVGGYMTNFRRGDFRFEISLHAMGGFDEANAGTRGMFAELGILDQVTPVKGDFMYRTFYPGGETFDTPDGFEAYRDQLIARFPAEADGITRLFADVRESTDVLDAYMAGDDVFNAYMQAHPEAVGRFMTWAYGNLGDALREYVKDDHLFAILAQLSSYIGVEPDNLSALYFFMMWNSYHLGGFYNFIGGSQSISDALAGVIEAAGGEILLNTQVTGFTVQDGKVVEAKTDRGACLRADWFVSNANLPQTVKLVGEGNLPADYVTRIQGMTPGWSLVVVYLGTDQDYTPEFGGAHELLIQDDWDTNRVYQSATGCDPSKSILLVANYSVVDATAAPAGKNVLSITGTISDECQDHWKWGDHGAFKEYKDVVARTFIDRVEAYLPGLSAHIEVYEVAAPQTLHAFTLNPRGTIYGFHQSPEQSLLDRPAQEVPGLQNLYLAGAWTFPGCGQSAVMQSGVMAANKILFAAAAK